ncbi:MAG: class I SAM-dependent methyltransferase, partial [Saprospiraceae bacterium]|nr:class I SAM-dependent methyltransferase [Saprospiraceae bacterium]
EIGTFTGYGSICLAQGLPEDGVLHTIEVNDELTSISTAYIEAAGLRDKIILHLGDATTLLPQLTDTFDLVFLDAGKLDYARHYELALPKIRSGGFLIADNVLWAGKVLGPEKDTTAQVLDNFNAMVQADERVENLLLPLRDGLMLVRKR